jgi:hypothetical protein
MKRMMAGAALLGLAIAIAGCGSSGSSSSAAPAAPTEAMAANSVPGTTDTSAPVVAAGGTCKYLSDSDAAALLPTAGAVKVAQAETPASKVTTCTWGAGGDRVLLVANELKSAAPVSAIKAEVVAAITEQIPGLGDVGGFETKTDTDVTVVFIKGTTQITLGVSTSGVNADAVAAAAKKIAAGI